MNILKDAIIHELFLELSKFEALTDKAELNRSMDPNLKSNIDKSRRKIVDLEARLDSCSETEKAEAALQAQRDSMKGFAA